jgi:hypothetical protein
MKGCLLLDDGTVNYYLYPTNWSYKYDGVTSSNLTGDDGQVMIQIPKFYYKYSYLNNVHSWSISTRITTGYDVHPAFIKDGIEVDFRYLGAYEAVLYDTSVSGYTHGNNGVTGTTATSATQAANDKIGSVSGYYPITQATRETFRTYAAARGTGWRQQDYDLTHALELLFLIEYGSFYSQSVLSVGITNVVSANWNTYNGYYPIAKTGNGNSIGNMTGYNASAVGTVCADIRTNGYFKWRGIENFYGHIWKFVDGININNRVPWVTNNSNNWVDNTSLNYISGQTLSTSDGYQNTLIPSSRFMLPATIGAPGDSSHKITDFYYQSTGWKITIFGGAAASGASCGFWYWLMDNDSSILYSSFGARLAF